jgi:hypothetical protein
VRIVQGRAKVIVPWANRKNVELGVPNESRTHIQFVFTLADGARDARYGVRRDTAVTLTPIVEGRL